MSNSSDDRRGRGPTQRTPSGYGGVPRPDVAPAPPRQQQPYQEQADDPYSVPPSQVARRVTSFDLEPSPLRGQRAPRDIEPPVDGIANAFHEVMTGAPSEQAQRQIAAHQERQPAPQAAKAQQPQAQVAQPRQTLPPPPAPVDQDLYAESRNDKDKKDSGAAPIVPARSVTGNSLTLVIAIMCFLACLTAGAVYLMNQSASAWLRDIAAEVTVQVEAREKIDVEKTVATVVQFLEKQPGIRGVKPLSLADNSALLEPWLGQADVLKGSEFKLPVPRLIALEIDRSNPPNLDALRTNLTGQFKSGVTLDDHRHWQQQIRTVTRSFALGGLAILMLVGAATTAIIVSATRSALSANKEIVEVLHFIGATDRFIAREFAQHFLRLGIKAGIVGAGAAMLMFLIMPFTMELIGGGTVTMAEVRRMIGTGTLDLPGYGLLTVVVVVVAALCMLTSRIGVYRILNVSPEGGQAAVKRRF